MILSTDQIDQCCRTVVEHSRKYDMYAHIIFDTLYKTGLRVNELLDYSRVTILDPSSVLVRTQKLSTPRVIPMTDFNPVYISHFASDTLDLFIRSYNYYAEKMFLYNHHYKRLYINNKRISTHLFRHNYVKRLFYSGKSIEEISNCIGEKDVKNTMGYVLSRIRGGNRIM